MQQFLINKWQQELELQKDKKQGIEKTQDLVTETQILFSKHELCFLQRVNAIADTFILAPLAPMKVEFQRKTSNVSSTSNSKPTLVSSQSLALIVKSVQSTEQPSQIQQPKTRIQRHLEFQKVWNETIFDQNNMDSYVSIMIDSWIDEAVEHVRREYFDDIYEDILREAELLPRRQQ
jgi:hypothetical protein